MSVRKCFNCGKKTEDYRYVHLVRLTLRDQAGAGYKIFCNQRCKGITEIIMTVKEEEYREEEEYEEEDYL
jgi:hypothetical protein